MKRGNEMKKNRILPIIDITMMLALVTVSKKRNTAPEPMSIYASYYGRPVMHTFYEKVSVGKDDLLEVWKEELTNAGFEARVLTLKDAERHPYFKEMKSIVAPYFGNEYDAMCFYRWLAMAASGGGWMSDYDTFPTNFYDERRT